VQTVRLAPGARALDFTTDVDWRESERILKAAFDLDVAPDTWAAETQFGTIRRPTSANTSWDAAKFEACAHRWVHVGEDGFGIAVANRRTYGHEVRRVARDDGGPVTVVRLSLLRSARFPDPRADRCRHRFDYAVAPAPTVRGAAEQGWRLAAPLVPTTGTTDALVSVDAPDVVIDTVKLAFDGSGDVVVRLHNAAEGRRTAALRFGFPVAGTELVDLRERPLEGDPLPPEPRLTLRPSQFVTVRARRTS
jgi:alpha-mannosidase